MPLAHGPDAVSPLVGALLAERGIEPGGLDMAVDARDEMLSYQEAAEEGDLDRALFVYFRVGLSVADGFLQILRWRFGGLAGIDRVLDFASGYGRATRFLARALPPDRLWIADVDAAGVRFQRERFGVRGVVSTLRPEDFALAETFDAVLVTSFFTHLPEPRFRSWLGALLDRVRRGGVLVFSVHDASLAGPSPDMPPSGLLFRAVSESASLEPADYGSAWVTEAFVRAAVAGVAPSASVLRLPRGLCDYQDLYVVVPEPDADFTGLGYIGEPALVVERCSSAGADGLNVRGHATPRGGTLQAVEILLDGALLASFPVEGGRAAARWGGLCRLPPGLSRRTAVLLLRVRQTGGASHVLRAGSVESFLLGSARTDLQVMARRLAALRPELAQLAGLRARIEAMEASRFWKMRGAWFSLKRALHLTDER